MIVDTRSIVIFDAVFPHPLHDETIIPDEIIPDETTPDETTPDETIHDQDYLQISREWNLSVDCPLEH